MGGKGSKLQDRILPWAKHSYLRAPQGAFLHHLGANGGVLVHHLRELQIALQERLPCPAGFWPLLG